VATTWRSHSTACLGIVQVALRQAVAVHHATLLAHVRRTGRPRGAHDLIIATTARATDRVLISTDAQAGFADLPEVKVRLLTP
jgi:tRNA(fMet)-specific endonuclease VapC